MDKVLDLAKKLAAMIEATELSESEAAAVTEILCDLMRMGRRQVAAAEGKPSF